MDLHIFPLKVEHPSGRGEGAAERMLFSQDFMVKQYTGEKSELNTEISLLPYNFSSATVTIKD